MGIREDLIALAHGYDGVSVSSDRKKYIELLGPGESSSMQAYFCDPKTSGCALTIRGLWRIMGIKDKRVLPNYVFGKAISWLVGIARDRGAWQDAKEGNLPIAGDFVLVGGDPGADGGVEHVFIVTGVNMESDGTIVLTSIDGGQRDAKGQQAIMSKVRRWNVKKGQYWDVSKAGSDPGSGTAGGRKVKGWGDWEKIAAKDSLTSNESAT